MKEIKEILAYRECVCEREKDRKYVLRSRDTRESVFQGLKTSVCMGMVQEE